MDKMRGDKQASYAHKTGSVMMRLIGTRSTIHAYLNFVDIVVASSV